LKKRLTKDKKMNLAMIVAIVIPIAFLAIVRWLDLYASGSHKGMLVCFAWGIVAFWLALQINTYMLQFVSYALLVTFVAPVIEEIVKSLILVYYVRRSDFTYFVDGAIYGFAAGACFAVLENLLYLGRAGEEMGLMVAISRAFSTALMHGSATALVGIALGRLKFGQGRSRFASLFLGWAAAMTLHITFNNVVNAGSPFTFWLALGLGLGGVALIAVFIFWGLNEEKHWLNETLNLKMGVSAGESAVVQKLDDLDTLLEPIGKRFGEDKRKQAEHFLKLQARLGLKRKVQEMTSDPKLRAEMDAQLNTLRQEIDTVRRGLGIYCMTYVRSILPPDAEPMWVHLGHAISAHEQSSDHSLWEVINANLENK
jgi:RsiW-degrading membrane proteinase PrsW (M82 family)